MKKYLAQFIQKQSHLEGIKTQEDLSILLKELHSDLLESILQGELEAHLGYSKNEKSDNPNARNGTTIFAKHFIKGHGR